MSALERYPWPGNVRELENAVQRAIALAGSAKELSPENLVPLDPRAQARDAAPGRLEGLKQSFSQVAHRHRSLPHR